MALIRCIDFETTGFPPDAGVVEVGWCDVITNDEDKSITVGGWESQLCNPHKPIEIAAMAIHHITDADVANAEGPEIVLKRLTEGVDYWAAHNAKFEKEFFRAEKPWICTLKAAYRLCPKAPNHQNQTIRYYLKTPVNRAEAVHTHRAGPDAYVTAHSLAKFLTAAPINTLVAWEQEPPAFPYCPIGKERGKAWCDVDQGFLSWMCFKAPQLDEDIKFNALKEFNRRKGG